MSESPPPTVRQISVSAPTGPSTKITGSSSRSSVPSSEPSAQKAEQLNKAVEDVLQKAIEEAHKQRDDAQVWSCTIDANEF